MKKTILCILTLSALIGCGESTDEQTTFTSDVGPQATKKLSKLVADNGLGRIFKISDTPLDLYEVVSEKGVFYVDSNMQYAIKGTITSIKTGKNFTAEAEALQLSKVAMLKAKTATVPLSALVQSSAPPVVHSASSHYAEVRPQAPAVQRMKVKDVKKLGDSLVKHVKSDGADINKDLFLGTVEGQEAIHKARKAIIARANKIRKEKYNKEPVRPATTEPQVTQDGKKAIPKVGYDYDGNPLPDEITKEQVQKLVNRLDSSWVTFYRAKEEKTVIGVFSSYTCPICRNLHNSIKELNAEGVTVAYLQYPRTRRQSEVKNMSYAWCSPDQQKAYDSLYKNQYLAKASCDDLSDEIKAKRHPSPIPQHVWMGKLLDVKGTPTIITKGGKILRGFNNTDTLLNQLADEL